MFLKLRPFIFSLIFFFSLEAIVFYRNDPSSIFWILAILVLLSLREGRVVGTEWKYSILPVLFTLSSAALLYLITSFLDQQVFIVIASLVQYLALFGAYRLGKYAKDQTARGMNVAAASVTIFFSYAGIYGLYLNFNVQLYVLMLSYFLVTLFISYQYLSIVEPIDTRRVLVYSSLLSLTMAEIAWVVNFWPFGYLTTGVIALILYYVLWDLAQSSFVGILSKKRVVANALFFSFLIIFILLTSKWIPVI